VSPTHAPQPYVYVAIRLPGGKRRHFWAEKLPTKPGDKTLRYIEVDKHGNAQEGVKNGVIIVTKHLYLVAPQDLISERQARMSLKYGELEVVD
jgi:hypothetical protein